LIDDSNYQEIPQFGQSSVQNHTTQLDVEQLKVKILHQSTSENLTMIMYSFL